MVKRTKEEATRETTGAMICGKCVKFEMGWCKQFAKSVGAVQRACVFGAMATSGERRELVRRVTGEMFRYAAELKMCSAKLNGADMARQIEAWARRIEAADQRKRAVKKSDVTRKDGCETRLRRRG